MTGSKDDPLTGRGERAGSGTRARVAASRSRNVPERPDQRQPTEFLDSPPQGIESVVAIDRGLQGDERLLILDPDNACLDRRRVGEQFPEAGGRFARQGRRPELESIDDAGREA
jgi:hypothetical protein